eukprot:3209552-Pleurochrysis_carterae.AAC.1
MLRQVRARRQLVVIDVSAWRRAVKGDLAQPRVDRDVAGGANAVRGRSCDRVVLKHGVAVPDRVDA